MSDEFTTTRADRIRAAPGVRVHMIATGCRVGAKVSGMADDLVAQKNGSISMWWQSLTVRAGRSADAVRAEKAAKRKLKAHQPEGGVYGADCLGRHNPAAPWPCDLVRSLDNPGFGSR